MPHPNFFIILPQKLKSLVFKIMKIRERFMIANRRDKNAYDKSKYLKQETENRRRKMKVIVKKNKRCTVKRTHKHQKLLHFDELTDFGNCHDLSLWSAMRNNNFIQH